MPEITLPLPPNSLRVNQSKGVHWGSIESEKSRYLLECMAMLNPQMEALGPVSAPAAWPVHLRVKLYLGKGQRCDPSDVGTWVKRALDYLVQRGLFPDDSSTYINPFTAEVDGSDRRHPRVVFQW